MIKKCLFKKLNYKFSKINASLNLKPLELNLADNAKCLCLCPHADDESIGMGGFLAMHPENFNVILPGWRTGVEETIVAYLVHRKLF